MDSKNSIFPRQDWETASKAAQQYLGEIEQFSKPGYAMIAGSIRRQADFPADIEIVTIFDSQKLHEAKSWLNKLKIHSQSAINLAKGDIGNKYISRLTLEGIKLDIFVPTPDNYGWILLLRTGSQYFNKRIIEELKVKKIISNNGFLYYDYRDFNNTPIVTAKIITLSEKTVFDLLGIEFIEPRDRNSSALLTKLCLKRPKNNANN